MSENFRIDGNDQIFFPSTTSSSGSSAEPCQKVQIGNLLNGSSRNQNLESLNPGDLLKFGIRPKLTDEQKAAREKLDKKVASTGIDYKTAKATLAEITKKYEDTCRSKFNSEQSKITMEYRAPYEAFDPYTIPDAKDKERYFMALAVIQEIENANSALLAQAGLEPTPSPSRDYADRDNVILF